MGVHRCCGHDSTGSSTCTTDGLSLVEVLVALSLSLVILLGIAPLWVTTLRTGVGTHEQLVGLQRWRVVLARLERDLRMASADGGQDLGCTPLLEATSTRVMLLTRSTQAGGLEIVAWEFVAGSLMRRRTPLPVEGPPQFLGGFRDNKTMIEAVEGGVFSYRTGGVELGSAVPWADLRLVDAVKVVCRVTAGGRRGGATVTTEEGLGR
ncbi:MAG: PulJ/GspJ family protein [Thermoleophilia bacterium]